MARVCRTREYQRKKLLVVCMNYQCMLSLKQHSLKQNGHLNSQSIQRNASSSACGVPDQCGPLAATQSRNIAPATGSRLILLVMVNRIMFCHSMDNPCTKFATIQGRQYQFRYDKLRLHATVSNNGFGGLELVKPTITSPMSLVLASF